MIFIIGSMTVLFATLGFTPEKVLAAVASLGDIRKVVVYTAFSKRGKERAAHALEEVISTLRKMGVETETLVLESPWNFLSLLEGMLQALAQHSGDGVVFNLTGGPKSMTVAATMASVLIGIPLIYFPEEEEVSTEAVPLPIFKLPYSSLLTDGQRRVLSAIERREGRAKSAEISKDLNIAASSLDYHLTRLSKAGIVEVAPLEEDRRHRLVSLTPSGRMILLADQYAEG